MKYFMNKMNQYTNAKVNISDGHKKKLQHAIQTGGPVSIYFRYEDLNGNGILALTQSEVIKMVKACESGTGTMTEMSKSQLEHNMKIEGGFLAALPGLAARTLPFLASAATTILHAMGIDALCQVSPAQVCKKAQANS